MPYFSKSTFECFSINNMHPWPVYKPSWYIKKVCPLPLLLSPSLENVCFEKAVWNLVCRWRHQHTRLRPLDWWHCLWLGGPHRQKCKKLRHDFLLTNAPVTTMAKWWPVRSGCSVPGCTNEPPSLFKPPSSVRAFEKSVQNCCTCVLDHSNI